MQTYSSLKELKQQGMRPTQTCIRIQQRLLKSIKIMQMNCNKDQVYGCNQNAKLLDIKEKYRTNRKKTQYLQIINWEMSQH